MSEAKQLLKNKGVELTDFISSSTYDAVVDIVDKLLKESDELDKDNGKLYNEASVLRQKVFELSKVPNHKEAKEKWDGICKCGHPHSKHSKIYSHNYSAGSCGVMGCNCMYFLHDVKPIP